METAELVDIDRGVLYSLQGNARRISSSTMAGRFHVSARTVRNCPDRLEASGVINGDRLDHDFGSADYQLHTMVVCTASIVEREAAEVP